MEKARSKQSLAKKFLCVILSLAIAFAVPIAKPEKAWAFTTADIAKYVVSSYPGPNECWGYANYIGEKLTGTKPDAGSSTPGKGWTKYSSIEAAGGLKIGDVVRMNSDAGGHSFVVYTVGSGSDPVITVTEKWGTDPTIHTGSYANGNKRADGTHGLETQSKIASNGVVYVMRYNAHTHNFTVKSYEQYTNTQHKITYNNCSCGQTKAAVYENCNFVWKGVVSSCTACKSNYVFHSSNTEYFARNDANLTSTETSTSTILTVIPKSTVIKVGTPATSKEGRWVAKVSYGGKTGYIQLSDFYLNGTAGYHSFVNGVCSDCKVPQISKTVGEFALAAQTTFYKTNAYAADSKSLKTGAHVNIVQIRTGCDGCRWGTTEDGYVARMDSMTVRVGDLPANHTHLLSSTKYTFYNDVRHNVIKKCACGYEETSSTLQECTFAWVGLKKKCTKCGTEYVYHDSNIEYYATRNTYLTKEHYTQSAQLVSIPAGTVIKVGTPELSPWGRWVATITYGGKTGYIQLRDFYKNGNAGVHNYVNGTCKDCGNVQVKGGVGTNTATKATNLYYRNALSSNAVPLAVGAGVVITKVEATSAGVLWGHTADGYLVDMLALKLANPVHKHEMVVDKGVAATCVTPGRADGSHCATCNDATVVGAVIPTLGHNIVADPGIPATCMESGLTAGEHCTRCDYAVEQKSIPALGHEWGDWAIVRSATCEAEGAESLTCAHDATHIETRSIATLGHAYGAPSIAFSDDGKSAVAIWTCVNDGAYVIIRDCDVTSEVTREATADEIGETTYIATVEADAQIGLPAGSASTVRADVPALGRAYGPAVITFSANGKTAVATWANLDDASDVRSAVCVVSSVTSREATCTAAGQTTYTAFVEGDAEIGLTAGTLSTMRADIPALGHAIVEDAATAATCTEAGLTAGEHCDRCDYSIARQVVPAKGHAWGEWETAIEDSCDADGSEVRVCDNDETHREIRAVAAKGHRFGAPSMVFSANGQTAMAVWTCENDASHVESAPCVVTTIETAAATCAESGEIFCLATVQGDMAKGLPSGNDIKMISIPALGHDLVPGETVEPTCTEPGLTAGAHCFRCGYEEGQEMIPVSNHQYHEGVCAGCGILLGDVNLNGVVNIVDAQVAYDIAIIGSYYDLEDYATLRERADVTGTTGEPDGDVTANDAWRILVIALRGWDAF